MDFSRSATSATLPLTTTSYQSKECVLYGSIKEGTNYEQFLQRLRGLCDPGVVSFHEHEMVFSLSTFVCQFNLCKLTFWYSIGGNLMQEIDCTHSRSVKTPS